jgi:glycosyltransferase involved in cell wall biosynthesis
MLRWGVNRTIGRFFESRFLGRTNLALVLTDRARAELGARFPGLRIRTLRHVTPLADVPRRQQFWDGTRPLRLLFIGFIAPRKGLPTLLEAVAHVRRERPRHRFELTICGGSVRTQRTNRHEAQLVEMARGLGLDDVVRFAGFVSDAELTEKLRCSDVVVLPYLRSKDAAASGPLIQGMTHGLVPIVTNARAMNETVRDGHNGLIVEAGNPRAIASALDRLFVSPDLVRSLGTRAADTMRDGHSWRAIGEAVQTAYASL